MTACETLSRTELQTYFTKALQPAEKTVGVRRQRREKLSDFGEALTENDVLERMEKAAEEKRKKLMTGSQRATSTSRSTQDHVFRGNNLTLTKKLIIG